MNIAVINQKGGAGKTTLAVHLACYLADLGRSVAFVDNDSQQSATRWMRAAAPSVRLFSIFDCPVPAKIEDHPLSIKLEELQGNFEVIICDGAPRLNLETKILMYFSDLILTPIRPSVLDLHATQETKIAVDAVQRGFDLERNNQQISVRMILNMVRTVGEQGRVMQQALQMVGLPVAKQTIGLRDAYSKAVTNDTVITRMTKDKGAVAASVELLSLFTEVLPNELVNPTRANVA